MRRVAPLIALAVALLAPSEGSADDECAWNQYGNGPEHSFSQSVECSAITPLNASTLVPKWVFPVTDSVTASPAVVDGVVYVGDWTGRFWAIDAETGSEVWHYDIDDPNDVAFGRIVSSAAVVDVKGTAVVLFGGGATLYALDAATGEKLASACVDPRSDPAVRCQGSDRDIEIESSPAVVKDRGDLYVLVGMDVHNARNVGRTGVLKFELTDDPIGLDLVWKYDPEEGENGAVYTDDNTADPLTQGAGTGNGCAGVWSSPAVDVKNDLVFFGTSSCSVEGPTVGESMYAIRLGDGSHVWHETAVLDREGRTDLDDDFGASPNLLPDDLVGFGGKDGWYYGRDRETGGPGWDQHAGQAGHLTSGFAVGGMIGTAAVGEVFDEPVVFATTALSTPIGAPLDDGDPIASIDAAIAEDPGRLFSLHAISARDGRVIWRQPLSRQAYGAPTYARGVLFVPSTFDFTVKAFDADTGLILWEMPLLGATSSSPSVVGDSIYLGTGTRTTDVEYKAFGGDAIGEATGSASPLSPLSSITAFRLAI